MQQLLRMCGAYANKHDLLYYDKLYVLSFKLNCSTCNLNFSIVKDITIHF